MILDCLQRSCLDADGCVHGWHFKAPVQLDPVVVGELWHRIGTLIVLFILDALLLGRE